MTCKALALSACITLVSLKSIAQYKSFYLRAGGNVFSSWLAHDGNKVVVVPEFSFSLGARLLQSKAVALTVVLPVSAGVSLKSDWYVGFDVPAMVELHLGSATGNNENAKLGCLFGAGVAYNYSGNYWLNVYNERTESDFLGLRFEAGISFKSDESGDTGLLLFSYGRGISDSRKNLISIGLHLIMGYKN